MGLRRGMVLLGIVLLLVGLLVVRGSLASHQTGCTARGDPSGAPSRTACDPQRSAAWWTWPGFALGALVALGGLATLAVGAASAPRAVGRR